MLTELWCGVVQMSRVQGLHSVSAGAERKKRYHHRGRAVIGEIVEEETLSKMCEWGLKMTSSMPVLPEGEEAAIGEEALVPVGWAAIAAYRVSKHCKVMLLFMGLLFWVGQAA